MMKKITRLLNRPMRHRKLMAGLSAMVFALAITTATGGPASAATVTYDTCGTPYSSAPVEENHSFGAELQDSASTPKPFTCIQWNHGSNIIVGGDLYDVAPDGMGPTMVVLLEFEDSRGVMGQYYYYEYRNTDGNGTHKYAHVTIPWPGASAPTSKFGIEIYICNGKSSTKGDTFNNLQCGTVHGPFHP